jgi:hypothetical protein
MISFLLIKKKKKIYECSPSIQIGIGITKIDDVANFEMSHTINLFEGIVINLDGRTIFLQVKNFNNEIETYIKSKLYF